MSNIYRGDMPDNNNQQVAEIQKNSPLDVSSNIINEIKSLKLDKDRELIKERLRDAFLSARIESATLSQTVRGKALMSLYNKIDSMNPGLLLQVVEVLSTIGEPDLAAITGVPVNGKGNGGATINILNSQQGNSNKANSANASGGSNRGIGEILEAIDIIASKVGKDREIIDVTPKK